MRVEERAAQPAGNQREIEGGGVHTCTGPGAAHWVERIDWLEGVRAGREGKGLRDAPVSRGATRGPRPGDADGITDGATRGHTQAPTKPLARRGVRCCCATDWFASGWARRHVARGTGPGTCEVVSPGAWGELRSANTVVCE